MSHEKQDIYCMRPMALDDLPTITKWFEDIEDLAMFDRAMRVPLSPEAFEQAWREEISTPEGGRSCWFSIEDAAADVVGIVGLEHINHVNGDAILPVCLAKHARKKGIGLRATAMMLDLAFDQLRLCRVTSFCRADNAASARMTKQAGFQEEGRMREAWFADGHHIDMVVIGILRQEWIDQRAKLSQQMSDDTVVILGRHPDSKPRWPPAP